MSTEDARARPSQVTVAGWAVVAASVIVVLAVFEAMGGLTSVDMRERVTSTLSEGAFAGLGISVDEAIDLIRWSLYVAGVAAVVTGVLGVYVLRRDKVARVVLTVAAVPIVLTSPVAGAFPGMVVGAGAAMLWTRPARDWFAGRPITPAPRPGQSRRDGRPEERPEMGPGDGAPGHAGSSPVPVPGIRGPEGDQQPPPTQSWGEPAGPVAWPSPQWAPPTGPPVGTLPRPSAPTGPGQGQQVPRQVRAACLVTWVGSAISFVGALFLLALALGNEDTLVDQVVSDSRWDSSADPDLIVPVVVGMAVVVMLWCLLNAVLAWFTWNRRRGAWVALAISVGFAAVVSVLGFPVSLAHMAALAGTLGLLTSAPTRGWFKR